MQRTRGSISEIILPKISDPRGDLTFIEGENHIPFKIARVYYLYNVPVESGNVRVRSVLVFGAVTVSTPVPDALP